MAPKAAINIPKGPESRSPAPSDKAPIQISSGRNTENTVPIKRIGLVRVGKPSDVAALEKLDSALQETQTPEVDRLSSHLSSLLEKAKNHRQTSGIDRELLDSLLSREGEYSAEQKSIIDENDEPEVFEPLTGDITLNAISWIEDMLNLPNGNIYSLDATPLPEMPEEVTQIITQKTLQKAAEHMQKTGIAPTADEIYDFAQELRRKIESMVKEEADRRAAAMNDVIEDQSIEGGFFDALSDCINSIHFPTVFLKGPVVYNDEEMSWEFTKNGPVPKVGNVFKPRFYSPSPFDMFPSANCSKINEGYIFERMRMEAAALSAFRQVPGFNADAIDQALDLYASSGHVDMDPTDAVRARLERRNSMFWGFTDVIEVYEFQGKLQGALLKQQGFKAKLDENAYYPVIAWICCGRCIMARLNTNPRGDWQYSADSYERRPGSIWGKGVSQRVANDQKIANGYRRAAAKNAAAAAGFQTIVDVGRLAKGETVTNAFPGKIWQMESGTPGTSGATNRPPVEFFQPQPIFDALERLIADQKKRADYRAGIPPYSTGNDNGRGAAETVGGLSILMNNAAKGLRSILRHFDQGIIRPSIYRLWVFNMIYHPDNSIKGDVSITPRGALGQVVKESMFMRRQDFLNMTANPIDMQIIGPKRRRALLEMQEEMLDLPKNSAVPSEEEFEEERQRTEQPEPAAEQVPPGAGAPAGGGVPQAVV